MRGTIIDMDMDMGPSLPTVTAMVQGLWLKLFGQLCSLKFFRLQHIVEPGIARENFMLNHYVLISFPHYHYPYPI